MWQKEFFLTKICVNYLMEMGGGGGGGGLGWKKRGGDCGRGAGTTRQVVVLVEE